MPDSVGGLFHPRFFERQWERIATPWQYLIDRSAKSDSNHCRLQSKAVAAPLMHLLGRSPFSFWAFGLQLLEQS
jgi:hypothetical protein